MAKMSKAVGTVAGVVAGIALIGSGIGAALGGTMVLAGIGSASSIAMVAGAVAGAANMIGGLTQRKPPAVGNTSQIQIGVNQPIPYTMGRTFIGGNMMHDIGYGGTVSGVPNPYSGTVLIWSGGGPIQEIEAFQADFETVNFSGTAATGYYAGHLYLAKQLGATPEASALTPQFAGMPGWGASSKLSGYAAGLISLRFDKKGKIFASGIPQWGAILKAVKAYDPRKDSTYPGGSGAHRWDNESTWEWTENPALHAITYARGRYHNGKKVVGIGYQRDTISLAPFVALANLCDANSWKVGGTIYEGPGISKWDNLKRILETCAAEPVFVGARLSVKFSAPKIALDTITADDLADGEYQVPAMKTWRDRLNGIVPRYRSEAHKWEYVQSERVSVATYVTEDGEEKDEEQQYDLIQQANQAAQIAAYRLVNGREFGPIVLPCKPRMIEYVPGEALEVNVPELGLNNQLCQIIGRRIDPGSGIVELTLESETTAKHSFALGRTGTAPPTPGITTGEEMDEAATVIVTRNLTNIINTSSQVGLSVTATDSAITLSNHTRRYVDKDVAVTGDTLTGLTAETWYYLYYDDEDRSGGAVSYGVTQTYFDAFPSAANPGRHYAGYVRTAATGGTSGGGGSLPPGGGGANPYELDAY